MTDANATYGYCPQCGAPGELRERRPDGNDVCRNGHTYPSRTALTAKEDFVLGEVVEPQRNLAAEIDAQLQAGGPVAAPAYPPIERREIDAARSALQDAINVGAVYAWTHDIPIEFANKTDIMSAAFGNGTPAWCEVGDAVPVFTDSSLMWRVPESRWVDYPVGIGSALPEIYRYQHKVRRPGWSVRTGGAAAKIVNATMAEFHEFQVLDIG